MSTSSKYVRYAASALLLLCCATSNAQNASGEAGSRLGKQLLDSNTMPEYREGDGLGTFDLGGVQVDSRELSSGATQADVDKLSQAGRNVAEFEQKGVDAFNQSARSNTEQGEASRALASMQVMSAEEALGDNPEVFETGRHKMLVQDLVSANFADCSTEQTVTEGQPIIGYEYDERTCSVGAAGASCGRSRTILVEFNEDRYDPTECTTGDCTRDRFKVYDQIRVNGECENDAVDGQCQVKWQCTDSAPRTIDGLLIDEAAAERYGLQPLYPGAPALCWAATSTVECPVCMEDEFGNQRNCTMVDVSNPEGDSCGALRNNGMCTAVGSQCLLRSSDGQCVTQSYRYSCKREVRVPTTTVSTGSTCAATLQCADGSCDGGVTFEDGPGMGIQEAMARMAVTDAIHSDVTYDGEIAGGHNQDPNQLTPEQQRMLDEAQLFKGGAYTCQKGYGGLVDCCKATDSNAKELFWEIHREIRRERQARKAAQSGQVSGYEQMQSGQSSMDTLYSPFTSMRDNALGGGADIDSYDDTSLSVWQQFMNRARAEIKPALSPKWACNDTEFDLAVQREIGSCSYAGTYCSKKVLGACLKKREAYCCYKSPMTRMLRASAEPGGVIDHGSSKRPDCSGIPLDEIDRIDWSVMDFNALVANMSEGGALDDVKDPASASQLFKGSNSTIGNAGRQDVGERTTSRVEGIDIDQVRSDISADAAGREWRGEIEATGPTLVEFDSGYAPIQADRLSAVTLKRSGARGAATAVVTVVGGDAALAGFSSQTVRWANGEIGNKNVRLSPATGRKGRVVLGVQVSGSNAQTGSNSTITIDVN